VSKEDREYELVVTPLIEWFKSQQPDWNLHKPNYHTAARGWDIEAWRENEYLLIEAKYIASSSISSFAGLVAAPLAVRAQRWEGAGWCCWAIGIKPQVEGRGRHIYQIFFDYMSRNSRFWKHYGEDLRMKYIFFVQGGEVTRIPFIDFLRMTDLYADRSAGRKLVARRAAAEQVLSDYLQLGTN
jgi:hypothetical protein